MFTVFIYSFFFLFYRVLISKRISVRVPEQLKNCLISNAKFDVRLNDRPPPDGEYVQGAAEPIDVFDEVSSLR